MSDKIQVAIKVRPLVARERDSMEYWKTRGKEIILVSSDGISAPSESYKFDYVFGKSATNFEVFEEVVKPLVDRAVKGFNATIFAYGQTSSGKTHTMLGDNQEVGIIQLVVSSMFDFMALSEGREFLVRASYMEIYNERVNDLLEQQNSNLKIREEDGRVVVSRLKEELVADTTKVMNLLKRGQKIRRIGETNLNERSSRSHTIFRMIIESRLSDDGEDGTIQVSQLNLVDLAGSERAGLSGATGDRLKEGCAINRSLFQLSQVVSQLSEGHQFVNFRDSKLTRILQPSLGGNAHTLIICTVTPASVEFTQSTLGFALRAKSVKNKPQVNEVMSDGTLLKKYARQLEKLQTELKAAKERNPTDELEAVESKLEEQERINSELQQRINNLMKSLIVSKPKAKNQRPNRRRTWGGGKSFDFLSQRFSSLVSIPEMPTIDTSLVMDADDFEFNTPYEDFEVQLIEDEREKCEELTSELLSVSRMSYSGTSNTRSSWNGNDDACIQTSPEIRDTLLRESASGSRTPHEVLYSRISTLEKEWSELESFTKRENDIIEELENELKLKEEMCLQLQNKLSEKEGILVETLNLQESLTHKLIEYEAALQKNKKALDSCQKPKEVEALELQVEELRMNISESNKQMTSCKRKLYNEVISLNPNCKNKITENSEPSEMLNVLMACIMEKEMEMLQYVQANQGVSSESPTKCNLTRSCSLKPENEFSGNDGEKAFEWLDLIQQIQDLERLKEGQEGTINNLQESKEKQEDTIKTLHETNKKQEETIKTLQETKEKQEEAIKTLQEIKEKQEETVKYLHETNEKQEETIKNLYETNKKQEQTIKTLYETNTKQEETIKDLHNSKVCVENELSFLRNDMIKIQDNISMESEKNQAYLKEIQQKLNLAESELILHEKIVKEFQKQKNERDEIYRECEDLKVKTESLERMLNELREENESLKDKLSSETVQQAEMTTQIVTLTNKCSDEENYISTYLQQIKQLENSLAESNKEKNKVCAEIELLQNWKQECEELMRQSDEERKALENKIIVLECSRILPEKENNQLSFSHFSNNKGCLNQTRGNSNIEDNQVKPDVLISNTIVNDKELMKTPDTKMVDGENIDKKNIQTLEEIVIDQEQKILNLHLQLETLESQIQQDATIKEQMQHQIEHLEKIKLDYKLNNKEEYDVKLSLVSTIDTMEAKLKDQEKLVKQLKSEQDMQNEDSNIKIGGERDLQITPENTKDTTSHEGILLESNVAEKVIVLEEELKIARTQIRELEMAVKEKDLLQSECSKLQPMICEHKESLKSVTEMNSKYGEHNQKPKETNINQELVDLSYHQQNLKEKDLENQVIALEEELRNAKSLIAQFEKVLQEKELLESECHQLRQAVSEQKESLQCMVDMNKGLQQKINKRKQEYSEFEDQESSVKVKDVENKVIALEEELSNAKSCTAEFEKVLQEKELLDSKCHQLQQLVSEQRDTLQSLEDMKKSPEADVNNHKQEYSEFKDLEPHLREKDLESKIIALEEELRKAISHVADFENVLEEKESLRSECQQLQQLVSEQRDTLQSLADMKKGLEEEVKKRKQECSEFEEQEPCVKEKDFENKVIALEEELRNAKSRVADFEKVLQEKELLDSKCHQLQQLVSEQRDTLQSLADMKKSPEEEVKKRKQECSEFEDQESCVKEKDFENKVIALEEELKNAKSRVADFEKVLQEKELLDSKCHQLQQLVSEQRDTLQSLEDMKKSPEEDVNNHKQEYSEFKDQEPCLREKDLESKIIALEKELRNAKSFMADFENVLEEKESLQSECNQLQQLVSEQRDTLQSLEDMKKGLEEDLNKQEQEYSEFEDQEPGATEKDLENKIIALEEELRNAKSRVADFEKVLQEKELLDSKCHQLQQLVSEQRDTLQSLADMKKGLEEEVKKRKQECSEFEDQEPCVKEKDFENKVIALEEELRNAKSRVADFEKVLQEKELLDSKCHQLQQLVSEQRDTLQSLADMKKGLEEEVKKRKQECSEFEDQEPCVKEKDFENKVIALEEELKNAKSRVADFEKVLQEKELLDSKCHQLQQLISEQRDTLQSLEDMKKSPEEDVNNHEQEYSVFKDQEPRLREKDLESKIIALEEELRNAKSFMADFENVLEEKESLQSECNQLQQLVSEQRDTLQSLEDMKKGLEEDLNKQEQEYSEFEDQEPGAKEKDLENKIIALEEELRNAKSRVADFEKVLQEKELLDSKCHQLQQLVSEQRDTLQSLADMKKGLEEEVKKRKQECSEFEDQEPCVKEKDFENKVIALEEELRNAKSCVADFEKVLQEKELLDSKCHQLQQLVSEQRDTLQSLADMKKGLEEEVKKRKQECSEFEDQEPCVKEKDFENKVIALEEELRNAKSRVADFENVLEEKESLQSECHQLQQLVSHQKESLQSLADMKSPEDDVNTHEQEYPEFEDQEPCLKQKDLENKIIALEEELRNSKSGIAQFEKVLEERESLQSECNRLQQLVSEQRDTLQSLEDMKKGLEEDVNKQEQEYSEYKDQEPCVKGKDLEIKIIALEEELRSAKSRVADFEKVLEERESLQSECNQLQQLVFEQRESIQSLEDMKKGLEEDVNNQEQEYSEFKDQEPCVKGKDLEIKIIALEEELRNAKSRVADFEKVLEEKESLQSECNQLEQLVLEQKESLQSLENMKKSLEDHVNKCRQDNSEFESQEASVEENDLEKKVVGNDLLHSKCSELRQVISDQEYSLSSLAETNRLLQASQQQDNATLDNSDIADLEGSLKHAHLESKVGALEEELRNAKSRIAELEKEVGEVVPYLSECCRSKREVSDQKLSLQTLNPTKNILEEHFVDDLTSIQDHSQVADHEENVKKIYLEQPFTLLEEELRSAKSHIASLEKIVEEKELLQSECCKLRQIVSEQKLSLQSLDGMKRKFEEDLSNCVKACVYSEISHEENVKEKDLENHLIILEEEFRNSKLKIAELEKIVQEKELLQSEERGVVQVLPQTNSLRSSFEMRSLLEERNENNERADQSGFSRAEEVLEDKYLEKRIFVLEEELKNAKSKITELERIVEEKELIQSECCKLLHTISEQKESIQSLVAVERKLDQQLLVDDEHVSLVHSEFSTLCENLLRERKDLEKSIVVLKEELRNAKIHLEEFEKKYEVEVKRKEELSDKLDDLQSALQISAEKCLQLQKEMSQLEKNYNTQEKQNNTKMHELEIVNITLENNLMAESKLKSDKELEITYLKKALNDKKNEISLVLEEAKHLEDRLNHEIILKTELEKNLHESQKLKNDVENKLKIVKEENMLLQNKLEDVSNCVTEQEKTFQTLKELKDKLEKKLLSQTDYDDIKKGFGELQLQFVEESNAKESLSKRLCDIERELNECKCLLQKVHSEKLELERSCQVFQDQVQEKERALAMTKIELETLTSKSENCGELQTEFERLQNSLQAQENKLLNFMEERNLLKEGIKQYTIQLQDLQCEMEILKNDKLNCERKLDNALKDMFILQAKYDSFQENHDKLENCLKDILGPDLISVNQQCEGNILDAIKELKFQYNNALKRKEILENSVQYLENELSEVKKQLCKVQEDNVGLTKKLSMEEELHSQIKILEKTNEGCKERIDTLFQHKMELQKDLDNIQIKVSNQKEEISSLNQEIENLKNQVEHYSILISEKEQSIDDLQSQKSKCDEKLKEMMEDHKCLVSKIHYLENVSVLQEATSEELDRAKCDLAKVIESLKDTVSLENHNNLKVQLENQMKVNRDLQNEIQYLRQFVEEQEQKCIAKCALSNEKLENMVKEKEMLMDMVKNLKKTCEEKELRIQQTEKVKETLSNEIDRLQFVTTEKEKTIHSLERSRHLEDHLLKQSELHDENLIMSLKKQLSEETRMKSELEKKLQVVQGELTEAKNLQEQSTESHVNYLTEIVRKQLLDICARDQEIKSIKSFLAGHLFRFFGNSVETSRSVMENLQCIVSELKKEGRPMGGKEREKLQNKIKSLEEQVASLKNTLKEEGYEYEAPYWVRKGNWAISNRKMRQLEKTVKELEQEIAILRQQNSPEESFMDCTLLAAGLSAPASNKFGCSKCKDFEEQLNKLKEELGGKNLCINALTARLDCKDSVSKKKIETLQEEVSSLKGENKHLQDFIGIYQEQLKKHQTTKYSQSTQTDPKFPSWESVRCLGSGSKIVNDHAAEVNTRKLVKLEEENEKLKRLVLDLRKRINQQDKEDKKVDQPLPSRQTRQTVVSSPRRRAALDRLIRDADQTLEQRRQPWPCAWKSGEKENSQARSSQKQDADGESSSTKRS